MLILLLVYRSIVEVFTWEQDKVSFTWEQDKVSFTWEQEMISYTWRVRQTYQLLGNKEEA